jgi:hypothetical protein
MSKIIHAEEVRMKRDRYSLIIFWSIFGIIFFLRNVSFASETRVASMGSTGVFIHDNSNVVPFPGSLFMYGNQIITEFRVKGDPNTFTGAVHFPFGDRAVGGVRLNRVLHIPVPRDLSTNLKLDRTSDVVFGYNTGTTNLGIRLSYTQKSTNVPPDTIPQILDESARYFEVAAGASGAYYDFGIFFNLPTVESKLGGIERKWEGTGYGIAGRYFLGPEKGIMYVPTVIFNSISADLNDKSSTAGVTKNTSLEFRVGLGFHYRLNKSNLVVLGVEVFGYEENKSDVPNSGVEKVKITNLPAFYLGGETYAKNWLVLRLGAIHRLQERKTTLEPINGQKTEVSSRDSSFDLTVGVGFQIGKFLMDLDINDDFLFEGPDFISGHGAGSAEDIFNRLSITYTF